VYCATPSGEANSWFPGATWYGTRAATCAPRPAPRATLSAPRPRPAAAVEARGAAPRRAGGVLWRLGGDRLELLHEFVACAPEIAREVVGDVPRVHHLVDRLRPTPHAQPRAGVGARVSLGFALKL